MKPSKRPTSTTPKKVRSKAPAIQDVLIRHWLSKMNVQVQDLLVTLHKLYELRTAKPKRRKAKR